MAVHRRFPSNLMEFERCCKEEWAKLPKDSSSGYSANIKKSKSFRTVENLRGRGRKLKVTPVLARRIVREVKKIQDHRQGRILENLGPAGGINASQGRHCTLLGSTDADQGGRHFSR
ncbi:hypothetical protein L3Q82_018488 [Scortum barcoo]|uniref:Uncharacterized protein n=1 Tax=Scortum barcoo TaxID=214431 RepID=A0ACB8VFK5_9TELE|nr:hypothetical protein L3Q82_018488 [Scortum barcoo]